MSTDIVIGDDELICALTNQTKKNKAEELILQSIITMLNEEYGFELADMERDYKVTVLDEGKKHKTKVSLAVFENGKEHTDDNLIRICVVNNEKVKSGDTKKGVKSALSDILTGTNCEFGLWTNGTEMHYQLRTEDAYGQVQTEDISDFPGFGQTFEDMKSNADHIVPKKPANDSLIRTFKSCHDYIYANEGMKKTAFWELLNLIFCKIYDEKRRFSMPPGEVYHRNFWIGVSERNTEEGLRAISARIKGIFAELKKDPVYSEVFDGNETINLSPRGLAYVAGELSKYSFLDATVDVKGMAYETIVSNTLKQESGQFFTPRNVIKCMVEMMNPNENTRVLDPACGSGGFLVIVLDHVRKQIAGKLYPELDELHLMEKYNSAEVNERVRAYAEKMIFGFDFDPDLKKAARMNMVMAGDGHSNIFNINSLDYPYGDKEDIPKINRSIADSISQSADKNFKFEISDLKNAWGKFDMVFTNPPFGAKVEVEIEISRRFELGHNWEKLPDGNWKKKETASAKAPEVLFLEQCCNFLKPGGKLAIVVPDGILGNPDHESTRFWLLHHFKLLASVDLPVETFLPQVGVQASLLFLQKKTDAEKLAAANAPEDYDVFMAIADAVGKDRRGVPIFIRDEDGAEILFSEQTATIFHTPDGKERISKKITKVKRLNDDLPDIAKAYLNFLNGEKA